MSPIPLSELKSIAEEAFRDRATLATTVETVLRKAILSGALKQGEELNQVHLARQLNVSRVPVREALQRLEAEGLVVSLPYRSTVVARLDPSVLLEIFDIRKLLEVRALELAIPHITDEVIADLEQLLNDHDETDDHGAWLAANRKLHSTIYAHSGREVLCQLIVQLQSRTALYLNHYARSVLRHADAGREHRAILEAIRQRDVELAKQRLEAHLAATLEALLQVVGEDVRETS